MSNNIIYPGGLLGKRIRHLLTISMIGVTVYFIQLNASLNELAKTAIEKGYYQTLTYTQELDFLLNDTVVISRIVSLLGDKDIQAAPKKIETILTEGKDTIIQIYTITEFFSWIQWVFLLGIAYSFCWILFDIRHGSASRTIFRILIFVALFNIASYFSLQAGQKWVEGSIREKISQENIVLTTARDWIKYLENGSKEKHQEITDPSFLKKMTNKEWKKMRSEKASGKVISRSWKKIEILLDPTATSTHAIAERETTFEGMPKKIAIETITLIKDPKNQWMVSDYEIKSSSPAKMQPQK